MSIYSTIDISREKAIEEIESRVRRLRGMSNDRLADILEAMVQMRGYAEDDDHDEYALNNFNIIP